MQGHGARLSLAPVKASWWMTCGAVSGACARQSDYTADRKPERAGGGGRRTFTRLCLLKAPLHLNATALRSSSEHTNLRSQKPHPSHSIA